MTAWQEYLETNNDRFVQELVDFLRIPSISSLSENSGDVQRAGEWVADRLRVAGVEHVEILPTAGHPVVYGDWLHQPGKPTVLIYGHFDVQPVDPLNLWDNPPFEPVIKDDRIYARGATDDKGNMFVPILAVEALLKTSGKLPVNLKFFLEGQEEIGSPNIPPFLAEQRERFACDLVVSADGGQWSEDQPELLVASKGLLAAQIDVEGAKRDLHSGSYGGSIQNPIHALVRLLDTMRGPDGKILIEGFFDSVVPLSEADRAAILEIPSDDEEMMADLGVDALFGEPGYSTLERRWARPTLEINGIWGGFQGEGTKTVLPSAAHAKITCRLVANQEPDQIFAAIQAHVEKHAPIGVKISLRHFPGSARAYMMPLDHPINQAAREVLTEVYGKEPFATRTGGTVPVYDLFRRNLDAYTVTFGFGLPDEPIHAPNEFYRLASFARGQRAYCMLLERFGQQEDLVRQKS
jgi:acetylornithine deacetylase/succinyl-diaminopimelate desuccinylase-like protein